MPEIGEKGEASLVVRPEDTAKNLLDAPGDSFPEVLATAKMIALMELAASRVLKPMLGPGQLSVGVGVDIVHLAPTPVGMTATAVATYLGTEGKLHRFEVEVLDGAG